MCIRDRTLKSIQITLAARLEKFNLESLAGLTATDELDLPNLGEKKVALFALIPDNDTSFNFLVSILYTQLDVYKRQEYPKVMAVLDTEKPSDLSEQECKALIEVLELRNRLSQLLLERNCPQ